MERLKELRKLKKITMKQLGNIIGVAESTISLYESGKREPDNNTLSKIADYFNVSVDYILGRTSDNELDAEVVCMKQLNEILKERRIKLNMTMLDLAKKVGVSEGTISRWESGDIANMKRDKIAALAKALSISPGVIMEWEEPSSVQLSSLGRSVKIPVLGSIPAGIPLEAIEDVIGDEEIPAEWTLGGKEFFALKIKGDSMFPKYLSDDIVIFEKIDTCDTGDECAVMVNGDDATFKKIERLDVGIILKPLNTAYDSTFYSNEEIINTPVRIIGKAKEIRRKV